VIRSEEKTVIGPTGRHSMPVRCELVEQPGCAAFHAGDRRFESGWGYSRCSCSRLLSEQDDQPPVAPVFPGRVPHVLVGVPVPRSS
jgi:hypothetical protein